MKKWLESTFNGSKAVGLAWLGLSVCTLVGPGPGHVELMARLFTQSGAVPQMVTDVQVAPQTTY